MSKLAFIALARLLEQWQFDLIDCQLHTDHLASLGATEIEMAEFQQYLSNNAQHGLGSNWDMD